MTKDEFAEILRENTYKKSFFTDTQFGDYDVPTVVIPKEQLEKFKVQFNVLLEFAAQVCKKNANTLDTWDLAQFLENMEG